MNSDRVHIVSSPPRPDRLSGPIQPPIQWVPGVRGPGREADNSPPSRECVELYLQSLLLYDFMVRSKSKVVTVHLTEQHAMKVYWGSGGISPWILDLGTGWRWVVSFISRPLYPQGKSRW